MPQTRTYQGLLSLHTHGEETDALFLSSLKRPLARELEWMSRKRVTVRYWITPQPMTRAAAAAAFLHVVMGQAAVQYAPQYSETTGYLWTDQDLCVGGHDLLAELTSHVGMWLILEIETDEDTHHGTPDA